MPEEIKKMSVRSQTGLKVRKNKKYHACLWEVTFFSRVHAAYKRLSVPNGFGFEIQVAHS